MLIDEKLPPPPSYSAVDSQAGPSTPPATTNVDEAEWQDKLAKLLQMKYGEAEWQAKLPELQKKIDEAEWKMKLHELRKKIRKYNWTKRGDEAAIIESMRDLAASHSDPQIQAYWTRRADDFERAPEVNKKAMLQDVGIGLAMLIASPFTISAAILMGTGVLLKASGDLLIGGKKNRMLSV
ncbi:hypothetical protein B0H11DRAFT_2030497 [Mycena galericulata]|nr:hypothetical protein B0H11DRAFT_2030497 [Mycena galericulata]